MHLVYGGLSCEVELLNTWKNHKATSPSDDGAGGGKCKFLILVPFDGQVYTLRHSVPGSCMGSK